MNKTLLLILCDFLLITLISLVRWDEVGQPPTPAPPPATAVAEPAPGAADADLLAALQAALEAGQTERTELEESLAERERQEQERAAEAARQQASLIAAREAEAAARRAAEAERARLESSLDEARRGADSAAARLAQTAEEAALARARAELMQQELQRREAEVQRLASEAAEAESRRRAAEETARQLDTRVQLVETERNLLRENVGLLQGEVAAVREEKTRIQEQAGRLAEGVTQLAERTGELREDIAASRPLTGNQIFNDFLAQRVTVTFTARRTGVFGPVPFEEQADTLLVSDGEAVYALLHVRRTPFNPGDTPVDWDAVTATVSFGGRMVTAREVRFLSADPRVAVVPLSSAEAGALGARVFRLALEPFRFPAGILVSAGGRFHGEVEFRLDPRNPRFVRMPGNVLNRLLGSYSPAWGDLVFSQTGELLGLMVTSSHCLLVDNFVPTRTLALTGGPVSSAGVVTDLRERVGQLPLFLR